jgi:phosphatidylglycerophosphate synthase
MRSADSTSAAARGGIAQVYRATLKREDILFNVYVCRPPAALLVYLLRNTRVAPNQVTFFSLFVSLVAAVCFCAVPWPLGLWLGVGIYELSYVFDKVDGMLARYRGVQSASGHLLDFLMDEIKAFVTLAAVATGAYLHTGHVELLLLGLFGVVCLASGIGMTTFTRRPEVVAALRTLAQPEAAPPQPISSAPADPAMAEQALVEAKRVAAATHSSRSLVGRAVRAAEALGRFFIHFPSYIWLAAVLSDARLFLYPYVAVNALYAARSMLQLLVRYGKPVPRVS